MSHDLYEYGTREPIYFKCTLDGVGKPGLTFDAADVKASKDGASFVNCSTIGAVNETSAGLGWYSWTPAATGGGVSTHTEAQVIIINIKDNDAGGEFDENALLITTGGNASARFSG